MSNEISFPERCPNCDAINWIADIRHDLTKGEEGMYWAKCEFCEAAVYEDGEII